MPFDSGTVSFRVFENDTSATTDEVLAGLKSYSAPPLDTLDKEPLAGWCSTRFIGDLDLSEETCKSGRFIRAQLMKAEKKIPSSLLKVYCKMEEIAEMNARGVKFLNRKTRSEIKARISEQLLPQMPPTLTAIQMVHDTESSRVYASAMSEKQHDAFCLGFNRATRLKPSALGPESAAERLFQVNISVLEPQCFSPDDDVDAVANEVGMDFLTWLWHFWEVGDGEFKTPQGDKVALMLEGPAVFHHEGSGAHEISVRRGLPLQSCEAKTALMSGKKLKSVKLTLTRGEDVFSATVNGRDFSFASLKIALDSKAADESKYDPETNFQNRIGGVKFFADTFFHLYGVFLQEITAPKTWAKTLASMKEWISNREELA